MSKVSKVLNVERKDIAPHDIATSTQLVYRGYNELADKEVEVDVDKLHNILLNNPKCWCKDDGGDDIISFDGQVSVISSAILNGEILKVVE